MPAPSRIARSTTFSLLGLSGPLHDAAEDIANEARLISGRWSRRIPLSVRADVAADGKSATITAGGPAAPMAYTFEGRSDGRPIAHPVYGHGERSKWTWAKQIPVRPFLRQAGEIAADRAADTWGKGVIDIWARQNGFR